ncbi:hypothetical protein [Rhodoferax ferrireducens]|uniref:hypothetical protein n=1 Tax=Rhodoferax ferrireducens TaxID=192843 RepID=UPI000E0D23E7|nr:hypothetical protein [Rhodoferax ferrireducens]
MDKRTSLNYEMISAWCGPLFVLIFVMSFGVLGHNLPGPVSPTLSPAEIGAHYVRNLSDLRLGWVISLVFISLYLPWSAQISEHMRHIEKHSRVMTYLQLITGALTVFVVSFGMLCWAVACFRPERDPAIIQTLHDIGWESLELQWAITTVQMFAMALVGLADKRETPLFPRWVCFLSIWCGLSFVPASLTLYFKTGPFAWNGLVGFYIPYAAWLVWCLVASYFMIKDIRRRMSKADIQAG